MNVLLTIVIITIIILLIINFCKSPQQPNIKSKDPEYSHHIQIKPQRAIVGYQHRYRKKRNPQDLLNVADVFNWGLPGLQPHKPIARCIYTRLATGLDPADDVQRLTRIEARERLLQMNDVNEPQINPREPHYQGPANNHVPDIVNNILNYDLNLAPVNTRKGKKVKDNTIKGKPNKLIHKYARYKPDANSVHDSAVTASVKKSVDNLKQVSSSESNIDKIKDYIINGGDSKELSNTTRQKALVALNTIVNTNSNISNLKMKETEILNLVFNRINQSSDPELRENLKETLVKELADAARGSATVCATGRVSRLVDTLNIIDPSTTIKDSTTIRREMLNKASNVQQKIYTGLSNELKKDVDSGKETPEVIEYENRVKKEITDTLRDDYVKSGIMKEDKFRLELDKWIEDVV